MFGQTHRPKLADLHLEGLCFVVQRPDGAVEFLSVGEGTQRVAFVMGVVTGIVQEFQFGMNWSDYSRFVGDVFGAPLAIEGLLAFFLESTFLGLWIFGWDRLPKRAHLASIWAAAIGTNLSAYFILAANSFMQNPVGYTFNAERGRAELESFTDVLTNKVVLITVPHTLFGAFMVAGGLMAAKANSGDADLLFRGVRGKTFLPTQSLAAP